MELKLKNFIPEGKCLFVKVHIIDGETQDFGPYDLEDLKRLYNEKRIDGNAFVFNVSLGSWRVLADFVDFQEVFGDEPPEVTSMQRRVMTRKELKAPAMLINEENRFNVSTVDLSMLALKITYSSIDYEFDLDESFELQIKHPRFESEKFKVKVLRLFDSSGEEGSLTLRFMDLSKSQKNALSSFIHF